MMSRFKFNLTDSLYIVTLHHIFLSRCAIADDSLRDTGTALDSVYDQALATPAVPQFNYRQRVIILTKIRLLFIMACKGPRHDGPRLHCIKQIQYYSHLRMHGEMLTQ